jgi:hypothetical protein
MNGIRSLTASLAAALLCSACADSDVACVDAVRTADLPPALREASGIALSRRDNSVLWAHNDSEGTATLYALDRAGKLLGDIEIPAAGSQSDWEDIAAGPCAAGDCLYIGDIGDNLHDRDDRAILRIAEPSLDPSAPVAVDRFPFRFPHEPLDAEALFVSADTTVYIITKGRRRDTSLYRYPPPLRADERVTLEHVQQLAPGVAQLPDMITGADASADGRIVVVRTYAHLRFYRLDADTLALLHTSGHDLTTLAEPQGEAIAIADRDTILLATEAGPAGGRPFLSRVTCRLP